MGRGVSIAHPVRRVLALAGLLRQNSYMIRAMVIRDMRARYMGSFLGSSSLVIHPLTQLALYSTVLPVVLKMRLGPEYGGAVFGPRLIVGASWMCVAEVVPRVSSAVPEQASVIKRIGT